MKILEKKWKDLLSSESDLQPCCEIKGNISGLHRIGNLSIHSNVMSIFWSLWNRIFYPDVNNNMKPRKMMQELIYDRSSLWTGLIPYSCSRLLSTLIHINITLGNLYFLKSLEFTSVFKNVLEWNSFDIINWV